MTRYGKEAVVIVSEAEWQRRSAGASPTLGALLARHARGGSFDDDIIDRPWVDRPVGADVE